MFIRKHVGARQSALAALSTYVRDNPAKLDGEVFNTLLRF
jgi:hypothetical protein